MGSRRLAGLAVALFSLATLALAVTPPAAATTAAASISDGEIRVGLFTDMSGIYSGFTGQGSVIAAQMAIDDAGGSIHGKKIRLVVADHGNDVARASAIARQWLEQDKVDVIADLVGSPIALAVQEINRQHKAVLFFNSVVSSALTGKQCAETGIHWMYDANSYAAVLAGGMTRRGAKKWFFVTVDNSFGANTEKQFAEMVSANGGTVLGSIKHPMDTEDFSFYLLKAQASGANVIGFINAGRDATNSIKQAFDLRSVAKRQTIPTSLMGINSVHEIKLPFAQQMQLHASFYWNLDAKSAAWSRRFYAQAGTMPHDVQAGVYSALQHYFKAVRAAGSDDGPTVVKAMRKLPIDDTLVRNARLREDGRMMHDVYLVQVKSPSEARFAWDYFKILQTIPAEQAFQPLEKSECPLVAGAASRAQKTP